MSESPKIRVFSHGGGWQSTAALVLSAQGKIDFPIHLFANVGDDSEAPETLVYVQEVSMPYAKAHGIDLIELRHYRRTGEEETLLGRLTRNGSRSISIPMRVANGAPGTRQCTYDFKLRVMDKWLRAHGATKDNVPTVGIGFSTDEIERVGNNQGKTKRLAQHKVYPLIELGLNRDRCAQVILDAGLPIPPKSACWFCPMHRPSRWSEMRRDKPEQFAAAADLEDLLNERRDMLGKDHMFMTRFAKPLREAVGEAQTPLFDMDGWGETCDEGTCFT